MRNYLYNKGIKLSLQKSALIVLLGFSLSLFSVALGNNSVHASEYTDALASMPTRIPDTGDSQYFTTSLTGNINGDTVDGPTGKTKIAGTDGYRTLNIMVYSNSPSKDVKITLNPVGRKANTSGNVQSCNAFYKFSSSKGQDSVTKPLQNCDSLEFTARHGWFSEKKTNTGIGMGIYEARATLRQVSSFSDDPSVKTNDQSSFSLATATGGARLGLQGNGIDTYINIYTSLTQWKGDSSVALKFRPPCNASGSYPFQFDDVQQGQSNPVSFTDDHGNLYQSASAYLDFSPSGSYPSVTDLSDRTVYPPIVKDGNGLPREITATFHKIMGGNGIGIILPYDTGDFYFNCKKKGNDWSLNNSTNIIEGIGTTYAADGNQTTAKADFVHSSFQHSVQNLPTSEGTAPSGAHNSDIWFYTWKGNSDTPSSWQKKDREASPRTKTLNPGASFYVGDGYPGAPDRSKPRSADIDSQLFSSGRFPISKGLTCEGKTAAYQAQFCEYNAGHSRWEYARGDRYCERVITTPRSSTDGSQLKSDLQNPPQKCVELGAPTQICSPAWNLATDGYMQQLYGGAWSGSIGRDVDEAWVGDSYGFFYYVDKSGAAEKTAPITSNVGGINGREISGPYGPIQNGPTYTIDRSQGGQTLQQNAYFKDIWDDGNCNHGGQSNIDLSVKIPYYYKLTPTAQITSPAQIEQGDPATGKGNVFAHNNGAQIDGNSERPTTWSENLGYRIYAKRFNPDGTQNGPDVVNNLPATVFKPEVGGGNTGIADWTPFGPGQTASMPIGTRICFYVSVDKGQKNGDSEIGLTTSAEPAPCITIVKTPKIRFENQDVSVGKQTPTLTLNCDPAPATPTTSKIATSGAPAIVGGYPSANLYGSWVEYGAFASGSLGLGTATIPSAQGGYNKLAFGNTPSNGAYPFPGTKNRCAPSQQIFQLTQNLTAAQLTDISGSELDLKRLPVAGDKVQIGEKNRRVSVKEGNINVKDAAAPPAYAPTTYQAVVIVNSQVASTCQDLRISLTSNGTTQSQNKHVCSTGNDNSALVFPLDATNGWKKPTNLKVERITTGSDVRIGHIQVSVQRLSGGTLTNQTVQVLHTRSQIPISERLGVNGGASCKGYSQSTTDDGGWLPLRAVSASTNTECYGVNTNLTSALWALADLPVADTPPVPPADLTSLKGRDIIIRASKGSSDCATKGSITINQNIEYDFFAGSGTYGNITELPRVVLAADCDIIIGAGVTRIDAWLVAGRNIVTCDTKNAANGDGPNDNRNVSAMNQADCAQPLTVNGPTFAKKLYALRTTGSDLTAGDVTTPAEDFNLRPDQLLGNYFHNRNNGSYVPVRETNLPPRY